VKSALVMYSKENRTLFAVFHILCVTSQARLCLLSGVVVVVCAARLPHSVFFTTSKPVLPVVAKYCTCCSMTTCGNSDSALVVLLFGWIAPADAASLAVTLSLHGCLQGCD
jgi:hypothetical protein